MNSQFTEFSDGHIKCSNCGRPAFITGHREGGGRWARCEACDVTEYLDVPTLDERRSWPVPKEVTECASCGSALWLYIGPLDGYHLYEWCCKPCGETIMMENVYPGQAITIPGKSSGPPPKDATLYQYDATDMAQKALHAPYPGAGCMPSGAFGLAKRMPSKDIVWSGEDLFYMGGVKVADCLPIDWPAVLENLQTTIKKELQMSHQKDQAKQQIGKLAKVCAEILDSVNNDQHEITKKLCKDARDVIQDIEAIVGR